MPSLCGLSSVLRESRAIAVSVCPLLSHECEQRGHPAGSISPAMFRRPIRLRRKRLRLRTVSAVCGIHSAQVRECS